MSHGHGERQARWQSIWAKRGLLAWLLWPISLLYGTLAGLRRLLYANGLLTIHRLPVPVVVVGNVVVGGAGKTPTVISLVKHLQSQGWKPGVLSRGYRRHGNGLLEVKSDTPSIRCGDEPLLIQRNTGAPVFVASRRAKAAEALLAAHPDVNLLLCDDGLQHLALGRDVAIAVFDDRGTGNGWLLPAGLLREPWPPRSGDRFRPDLVLHQRPPGAPRGIPAEPAGCPTYCADRRLADQAVGPQGQRIDLDSLKNRTLTAMAGVARPEVFFDMLRARGLAPTHTVALPDHADRSAYAQFHDNPGETLVCTEKDAVKFFPTLPAGHDTAWAVPLELTPEPAFFDAIDRLLTPFKPMN